MRKFSFKLEAVRRIREQEEQLVQVELAAALRERASIVAQLEASREAEASLYRYMEEERLSASDLLHISRYDTLHRQKIVDLTVQLSHRDAAIERIRLRLTDASARRKALDRLRDRQREAHRTAFLAEESRELDEIGTARHAAGRVPFGVHGPEVAAA